MPDTPELALTHGFLEAPPADTLVEIHLEQAQDGLPNAGHLVDRATIIALNGALATGRPLLIRGEPGVGKSQIARVAARLYGRRYVQQAVDAHTDTRDLLYSLDAVDRLAKAQVLAVTERDPAAIRKALRVDKFLRPGALWWALAPELAAQAAGRVGPGACSVAKLKRDGEEDKEAAASKEPDLPDNTPTVVLIDEIDKADSAVPNALLDALGSRGFEVPGVGRIQADPDLRPLILITTNGERPLPAAFVRRCFVLDVPFPANPEDWLPRVAKLRVRGVDDALAQQAATWLLADRTEQGGRTPGVAEYVDLLEAVTHQPTTDPKKLAEELRRFVFQKRSATGAPCL